MPPKFIHARCYYEFSTAQEIPATDPDVVICRRAVDYLPGLPPPGAHIGRCSDCHVWIVSDPRGPHPDKPHICLQCAGITPLPLES